MRRASTSPSGIGRLGVAWFARHWLSAGHLLRQPSECAGAGQGAAAGPRDNPRSSPACACCELEHCTGTTRSCAIRFTGMLTSSPAMIDRHHRHSAASGLRCRLTRLVAMKRDRGFESVSLQRGVMCEPDFRGAQPQAIRFRAASPPRAVSSQNYRFESDRPRKESLRLICRGQSGIALRLPQHRSRARAAIRITAAERLNSTLLGHSASH